MNLVDAYVKQVIGNPHFKNGKYWQKVKYSSIGGEGETDLMFNTMLEACSLFIGYKFQI